MMQDAKILGEFPNYIIFNDGRVFSKYKNKFLKAIKRKDGYFQVQLKCEENGERKNVLLHRLVALAFVPNPRNVGYVNHIDGNKGNCHYSNLEWCTISENLKHAYKTGLKEIPDYRKAVLASLDIIRKPVVQYDTKGMFIKRYDSISNASRETGVSITSIVASCKRRNHLGGGFFWCYEKEKKAIDKSLSLYKRGYGKKSVYQFSLDGELIKQWNGTEEIIKELGFAGSSISNACHKKINQVYGFIWSFTPDISEQLRAIKNRKIKIKNRSVLQYTLDDNLIKKWNSIQDAAKCTGIDGSSISKNCRGKKKHTGGFVWKYENW